MDELIPVYTNYCSNQQTALDTVEKLKAKSKKFQKFCQDNKLVPETRELEIDSFVVLPVQRICKYPLLFKVCPSLSFPLLSPRQTLTTRE